MKTCMSLVLVCLVTAIIILAGCNLVKAAAPASNPMTASEPLTGNWAMTRTGISPQMPPQIPSMVVDQLFPASPTWSISVSGDMLSIKYDGRATWFNPLGITVTTRTDTPSQAPDKQSCTFSGGGSINESKLPGVMAVAGAALGNPQDIAITYTDKIAVKLSAPTQMSATITYSATGKYKDSKGPENFNYSGTLTYTGKRK